MPKPVDISKGLEAVRHSGEFKQNAVDDFWNHLFNVSGINEFLTQLKQAVNSLLDRLFTWLGSVNPEFSSVDPEWFKATIQVILFILLVLLSFLFVFLVYRYVINPRFIKRNEQPLQQVISLSEKMSYSYWLDLSECYAQEFNYRESCRSLFLASLHYLKEKAFFDFDETKTNSEYIHAVKHNKPLQQALRQIVLKFDYLWYGNQEGNLQDHQFFLKKYYELASL